MTADPESRRTEASAVVLAGGRSSRFGSDKLTAELDGAPLLHHALRAVRGLCDELVLVVARDQASPALPGDLGRASLVVRDADVYPGPLAALLAGARAARSPRLLVVAGDMPDLRPTVLARLLRWPRGQGACLLADGEPQVLPLGLDRDAATVEADRLLAAGERSLRTLVARLDLEPIAEAEWRTLDPTGRSLRDIDRPEDLTWTTDVSEPEDARPSG